MLRCLIIIIDRMIIKISNNHYQYPIIFIILITIKVPNKDYQDVIEISNNIYQDNY